MKVLIEKYEAGLKEYLPKIKDLQEEMELCADDEVSVLLNDSDLPALHSDAC